jgi:hypothetical protein
MKDMKDMFDDSCEVDMRSPRYARDDKNNAPGETVSSLWGFKDAND